jgi:hypothetical protein
VTKFEINRRVDRVSGPNRFLIDDFADLRSHQFVCVAVAGADRRARRFEQLRQALALCGDAANARRVDLGKRPDQLAFEVGQDREHLVSGARFEAQEVDRPFDVEIDERIVRAGGGLSCHCHPRLSPFPAGRRHGCGDLRVDAHPLDLPGRRNRRACRGAAILTNRFRPTDLLAIAACVRNCRSALLPLTPKSLFTTISPALGSVLPANRAIDCAACVSASCSAPAIMASGEFSFASSRISPVAVCPPAWSMSNCSPMACICNSRFCKSLSPAPIAAPECSTIFELGVGVR